MPSHKHTRLRERITALDIQPENPSDYATWVKNAEHLALLRENAKEDELVVVAVDRTTLIHTVVVSKDNIQNLDDSVLLHWSGDPYSPRARYVYGEEGNFKISRDNPFWNPELLSDVKQLVFGRTLRGSKDGRHYEILQEYAHLADIHWRPERHAYCRFDELGDWKHVVSITQDDNSCLDLVTFKRQQLDQFLIASNSVLVRTFEFILYPLDGSVKWTTEIETISEDASLFYHRRIEAGKAGYYRGVQIIYPSPSSIRLLSQAISGQTTRKESEYAEFMAWDWRHKRIADISTSPSATTNHMVPKNDLPHALSPAFFRAEVLSKYKNDPDKYTIDEEHRSITCQGSWRLRSYGINKAGQVHAYICDLGLLPYREQQYWQSFNEEPKDSISQRALANDFKGIFFDSTTPLEDLRSIVRRWSEMKVQWWQLREIGLVENIHVPNNRNEWAQSFLNLDKLIIGGFNSGVVLHTLKTMGKDQTKDEKGKSISLMEKVLVHQGVLATGTRLDGLRTVRRIRDKCGAHPRGSDAIALEKKAEEEYGSHSAHFESVCEKVVEELDMIERVFCN